MEKIVEMFWIDFLHLANLMERRKLFSFSFLFFLFENSFFLLGNSFFLLGNSFFLLGNSFFFGF